MEIGSQSWIRSTTTLISLKFEKDLDSPGFSLRLGTSYLAKIRKMVIKWNWFKRSSGQKLINKKSYFYDTKGCLWTCVSAQRSLASAACSCASRTPCPRPNPSRCRTPWSLRRSRRPWARTAPRCRCKCLSRRGVARTPWRLWFHRRQIVNFLTPISLGYLWILCYIYH